MSVVVVVRLRALGNVVAILVTKISPLVTLLVVWLNVFPQERLVGGVLWIVEIRDLKRKHLSESDFGYQ